MNKKKLLSFLLAVVLCLSMAFGAFAAPEEESSVPAQLTHEDESSQPAAENEPDKADVVAAIIRLLGSADLKDVKKALNDINEAMGLPRVEDFTDMAAYADALYGKFKEMGLSYDAIINAVSSSELIDWVNGILFGSHDKPAAEPIKEENEPVQNDELTSPDTGLSHSAAGAAAVTLLLSLGVVVLLKKRGFYAE
ncbi:MAG: hypothetical protein IJU96_01530 [Clostridia bacterium]|nr:hypothetical protein [Clostridia bacterium]